MVTAFVLLNIARGQVNQVAEQLSALEGISEVHSVAGRYDLVTIIRVANNDALAELVTEKIRKIDGIEDSETLIGFKVVSRYDLERMFSIGL